MADEQPEKNWPGIIMLGGVLTLFASVIPVLVVVNARSDDDSSDISESYPSYTYTDATTDDSSTGPADAPPKRVPDRIPNSHPLVQRYESLICVQLDNITFEEVWQSLRVDQGLSLNQTNTAMVGSIESHCPRHIRYVR